jgi:hypothetical protein
VLVQNISNGTRSYNSLNVRVQHRLSHGFSMMANYTWSKSIEQNSLLNPSDTSYEKHVSSEDYPHHLVISSTYKLPYASFGGDGFVGHLKHALLGGWAASGTYLLQSGPPLSWGNVVYLGGPLNLHTRETNKPAFDITQFDRNSADQPADNIRTFHTTDSRWRGDKTNNLDASLARQVSYHDRITGELRIEAFNLFNHPVFSNPNLTPTSSSFGLITSQAGESRTMQVSAHVRF